MAARQTRRLRIKRLCRLQARRCFYCNTLTTRHVHPSPWQSSDATVDHKTPLSRGGLDDAENRVMACWQCNQRKNNLTAEEFMGPAARPAVVRTPLFSMPSSPDDRP